MVIGAGVDLAAVHVGGDGFIVIACMLGVLLLEWPGQDLIPSWAMQLAILPQMSVNVLKSTV